MRASPTAIRAHTLPRSPHHVGTTAVKWVSEDWALFCGFNSNDLAGKSLRMIQGPATDRDTLEAIKYAALRCECISATLVNYTNHGLPFQHRIDITPLYDSFGFPRLFKVTSSDIISSKDLSETFAKVQLSTATYAKASAMANDVLQSAEAGPEDAEVFVALAQVFSQRFAV